MEPLSSGQKWKSRWGLFYCFLSLLSGQPHLSDSGSVYFPEGGCLMVVELHTPSVLIPNKTVALPAITANTHQPQPQPHVHLFNSHSRFNIYHYPCYCYRGCLVLLFSLFVLINQFLGDFFPHRTCLRCRLLLLICMTQYSSMPEP